MFGLNEKIIENIIEILKKYDEVEKAVIFGSRARGDYKKASDIDMALYGDKLTNSINTKIFYEIDDLYLPYKLDLINFNSLEIDEEIRKSIIEEGVEFYAK